MSIALPAVHTANIMQIPLMNNNSIKLDFGAQSKFLNQVDLKDTFQFHKAVFDHLNKQRKTYGVGGYFEDRVIYTRSELFEDEQPRNIHLGVDIWSEKSHAVQAPLNGTIIGLQNNEGFGNYGPTIILEHNIENSTFYSLYGHLSLESIQQHQIGDKITAGQHFCDIGLPPVNGDWPPHLHFQLMRNMLNYEGDFPGVCSPNQVEFYRNVMIDPNWLLKLDTLK